MSSLSVSTYAPEQEVEWMARALELASRGRGLVEPNPMVGCVIVADGVVIGEGWHRRCGGPHAEVEAIRAAVGSVAGSTLFVTLEPCSHHGKTPPCTNAIIAAGVQRVVAAMRDPFPQVAGRGFEQLRAAGVAVDYGLLGAEANRLNAPYIKVIEERRPWVIAKWAMTLDGKLAAATGHSRWISSEASRRIVHEIRGRVDAILVGSRTAYVDDPQLTARPAGLRVATRVVFDTHAKLPSECHLVRTAREVPVLVAVGEASPPAERARLTAAGCEVYVCRGESHAARLTELLEEMARRRWTNILVEGGGRLFGLLWDLDAIDEAHVFIAPKIVGGAAAPSPLAGMGLPEIPERVSLYDLAVSASGDDIYIRGRVRRE